MKEWEYVGPPQLWSWQDPELWSVGMRPIPPPVGPPPDPVILPEAPKRRYLMSDEDCDHEGELVYLQELREVRCERCGEMWQAVEKHLRQPGVPFADEQRAGAELK